MKKSFFIYILFFFSGISGLIYETIWLRILGRILGNTVYATSTVLAVFMAGMALGSYIIGKLTDKQKNPLRLYAFLELFVGISAVILYFLFDEFIPLYHIIYTFFRGDRLILTFFQAILLFLLLLIPTCLMGGTLPLLSSYTRQYRTTFSVRIGNLYGLNTLGAVVGVIGSGIWSIGELGELNTVLIGVIINFLVSLIAVSIAKLPSKTPEKNLTEGDGRQENITISPYSTTIRKIALYSYGISGFTAIAYEILWTRMLQLHLGTSIYAFSMMLGIYLLGVGIGSIAGGRFINKLKDPLGFFGLAQIFIALYSILGLYLFTLFQPNLSIFDIYKFIIIPGIMIFPITLILGMIFPAISRSSVEDEKAVGYGIGRLYTVNTLGAIGGSLICGFVLINLLGTRGSMLFLSGINIIIGLVITLSISENYKRKKYSLCLSIFIILGIISGILSPDPFLIILKRKIIKVTKINSLEDLDIFYYKESTAATTTAFGSKSVPDFKKLWVNGSGMTNLCIETKLMAHIPILLNQNPRDMLIICMGMGTTLRSALKYKDLKCDVVELVPEVYECFKYFHKDAEEVLANKRVHHYADDGRNFLLMSDKSYDIITIDPPPPIWTSGVVNLYSIEFFKLCKNKLKPGGIMCLWIPPDVYSEVKFVMATFQKVFPNTTVWRGPNYPGLYMVGTLEPLKIDVNRFRLANQDKDILADLTEWDKTIPFPDVILSLYLLSSEELENFVSDTSIITDNNPYVEFPLWRKQFDPNYKYILDAPFLYRLKVNNLLLYREQ